MQYSPCCEELPKLLLEELLEALEGGPEELPRLVPNAVGLLLLRYVSEASTCGTAGRADEGCAVDGLHGMPQPHAHRTHQRRALLALQAWDVQRRRAVRLQTSGCP